MKVQVLEASQEKLKLKDLSFINSSEENALFYTGLRRRNFAAISALFRRYMPLHDYHGTQVLITMINLIKLRLAVPNDQAIRF